MIRVEVSSDHGVDIFDLPVAPREGDYIRVPSADYGEDRSPERYQIEAAEGRHGEDRCERVRYCLWSLTADGEAVVTVDTDCVTAPA